MPTFYTILSVSSRANATTLAVGDTWDLTRPGDSHSRLNMSVLPALGSHVTYLLSKRRLDCKSGYVGRGHIANILSSQQKSPAIQAQEKACHHSFLIIRKSHEAITYSSLQKWKPAAITDEADGLEACRVVSIGALRGTKLERVVCLSQALDRWRDGADDCNLRLTTERGLQNPR